MASKALLDYKNSVIKSVLSELSYDITFFKSFNDLSKFGTMIKKDYINAGFKYYSDTNSNFSLTEYLTFKISNLSKNKYLNELSHSITSLEVRDTYTDVNNNVREIVKFKGIFSKTQLPNSIDSTIYIAPKANCVSKNFKNYDYGETTLDHLFNFNEYFKNSIENLDIFCDKNTNTSSRIIQLGTLKKLDELAIRYNYELVIVNDFLYVRVFQGENLLDSKRKNDKESLYEYCQILNFIEEISNIIMEAEKASLNN